MMLRLTRKATTSDAVRTTLTLPYEQRIKSRLRVTLDDGEEAGLLLPRGSTLREGDCLLSEEGVAVRVRAAAETLSSVCCTDPHLLARACYHLGNRHVPLEILADGLRYRHDRVLDEMLRRLGLAVGVVEAPFEPEAGAYGGQNAGHAHGRSHSRPGHDHEPAH